MVWAVKKIVLYVEQLEFVSESAATKKTRRRLNSNNLPG